MPTIVGAVLICLTLIWSLHKMTQALIDAIERLKTEVAETITAATDALRAASSASDETDTVNSINAVADQLDAFQASLKPAPVETPTEVAPEAPEAPTEVSVDVSQPTE